MPRKPDLVTIESERGTFDRFSSIQITNDIDGFSEAVLETGDDGSTDIFDVLRPGQLFSVKLNGRLRMTGRAEVNEITGGPDTGTKIRVTLRTKLADAKYRNADPKLKMEKATIKSFLLQLYAPLGYKESDFVFNIGSERDLMTGTVKGHKPPVDISPAKADQMKVNPNETMFACADRQLKRLHVQHWDAPDGRIVVGAPDDEQAPSYRLQAVKGPRSQGNNVDDFMHGIDWSEVPTELWVQGKLQTDDGAGNINFKDVRGIVKDSDLAAEQKRTGHFNRLVVIPSEWAKTQAAVDSVAAREMSLRRRAKDAWTVRMDAWTHWNGQTQIPYATDTTADLEILGGPKGLYLIHKVGLAMGVDQKIGTMLGLVAKGIWAI